MKTLYRVATAVAAMGFCAPVLAQGFDTCRSNAVSWREREVARQCVGKTGDTRRTCEQRIGEVYMGKVRRCTAVENQRLDKERAREAERREREKLRARASKSTDRRN